MGIHLIGHTSTDVRPSLLSVNSLGVLSLFCYTYYPKKPANERAFLIKLSFDYFAALYAAIESTMAFLASAASPQPSTFTHLPSSKSL
ncbi:MAG: hypothetical protein ACI8SR_000748 [Oceanicoccus sp.]|jgi:hypothetical protein